jgi:hypothetical protein
MKKSLTSAVAILCFLNGSDVCAASPVDVNNLAGNYTCTGYDRQDKDLRCQLTVTLDAKNSLLQNGYGAYKIKMVAPTDMVVKGLPPNIAATGEIASNGNTFALSFKNTNPKAPTDYGTGIGTASHVQDKTGAFHTVLHFFSYQSVYKGGDNSTWTCKKST